MERAPDAGDTTEFRFEKLSELVAWTPDKEKNLSVVIRGIAATNKYGYVACVCERGFYVVDHGSFGEAISGGADTALRLLQDCGAAFKITLDTQPTLLAFSTTGLTLAVNVIRNDVPVVLLYDTRAFLRRNPATQPFHTIIASNQPGNIPVDLAWIPLEEEAFVVVLRDGSLGLFEIKAGNETGVHQLDKNTAAMCVSWSPKGKQFVVGRPDGSLVQFKPDLTAARVIPGPKGQPYVCQKVVWLSTFVFAVSYIRSGDTQPTMVIVNAPKTGDPIFTDFGDVCGGFTDQQRLPFYHFWALLEWKMLLVASNTGPEVAVLACQSEDETTGWLQLILDETGRAEMPLVGADDNFPLGVSVLTCTPMPVLVVVTSLGLVVSFRISNQLKIKNVPNNNAICSATKDISAVPGERSELRAQVQAVHADEKKGPSAPFHVDEKKPMQIPVPSAFSQVHTATHSPLQQSTNTVFSATTGSSLFGGGQSSSSSNSQFTQPLFGGGSVSFGSIKTEPLQAGVPPNGAQVPQTSMASSTAVKQGLQPASSAPKPGDAQAQVPTILTTVISTKPPLPITNQEPSNRPPQGPVRIPSKDLVGFMRSVAAHGRQIGELKTPSEPLDQLSQRMETIVDVLDSLTSFYNEAALDLSRKERILEERLHVVEEAMLIVERCSDPQFRECLKLLPLDPMRRRQYEDLEDRLAVVENKLKSLNNSVDLELDLLEGDKITPDADQQQTTLRMIRELEETSLHLGKKVHGVERQVRQLRLNRSFRSESHAKDPVMSPAEVVSRLYPSLLPHQPPKISTDQLFKLRQHLKSQPPRVTKHEIVLYERGVVDTPNKSVLPVKAVPPKVSNATLRAAHTEKLFDALWSAKICSPESAKAVEEQPRSVPSDLPKTPLHVSTPSVTSTEDQRELTISKTLSADEFKKASAAPPATSAKFSGIQTPASSSGPALPRTPSVLQVAAPSSSISGTSSFGGFGLTTSTGNSAFGGFGAPSPEFGMGSKSLFGQPPSLQSKNSSSFLGAPESQSPLPSKSDDSVFSKPDTVIKTQSPSLPVIPVRTPAGSSLSGLLSSDRKISTDATTSLPSVGAVKMEQVLPPLSSFGGFSGGGLTQLKPSAVEPSVQTGAGMPSSTFGMATGKADTVFEPSHINSAGLSKSESALGKSAFGKPVELSSGESATEPAVSATSVAVKPPTGSFSGLSFGSPGGFGSSSGFSTDIGTQSASALSSAFGSKSATVSSGPGSATSALFANAFGAGFNSNTTAPAASSPAAPGSASSAVLASAFGSATFGPSTGTESASKTSNPFSSGISFGGSTPATSGSGFGTPFGTTAGGFGQPAFGGAFGSSSFGGSGFGAAPQPAAAAAAAPALSNFGGFKISDSASNSSFSSPQSSGSGFGAAPAFGSSASFSSSPFSGAQQQTAPQSGGSFIWGSPGGFASYSQQSNVSFGTVAQSGQAPSFGSQPQQVSGFGGSSTQGGFGPSNAFGSQGGFGSIAQQGQPTGFGGNQAPSAAPAQTNSFMQYR